MTDLEQHQQLEHSLEFIARRATRRLEPLRATSQRAALLRLAIILVGVFAALGAAVFFNGTLAWMILAGTLLVFSGVVYYHRRLDGWIETLTLWRAIKLDQLARRQLAWDELPPPRPVELPTQALARDLDLTGYRSLHHLLDTTISRHGTQRLAEWLTHGRPDAAVIAARQKLVRELTPRARLRERFQLTYRRVMKRELEGDNLLEWLKLEFPTARLRWTLPVACLLVALDAVLFGLWNAGILPPLWLGSLAAYAAFYFWNQSTLETVLEGLVRVNAELDKFRALLRFLERASYANAPQLAALCAPFHAQVHPPSQQLRRVGWITGGVGLRSNPFLGLLLNLILPWDFLLAFLGDRQRARVAHALPVWVETIHELDALIALANFAALQPTATLPEICSTAQPVLYARQLGHPLLPAATRVCNDFEIEALGQVDLLTGSNMAGKSTFLKTIGVNFSLAYAGAPVLASKFVAQPFRLHTCIRITDSIVDGFSFFYAEVKCLKALLLALQNDAEQPLLYLIDEIFRGTNNRERLIGSRAYIQTLLGARGVGLIATHDLELAHLADANPQARNLHFRDDVRDGRLVFDYRLRTGPCPTTNALKIMQLEGLPIPPLKGEANKE